jgi:EAL domain-containing protein (putative c-di-GMP-specific phosphodiesterase class I)
MPSPDLKDLRILVVDDQASVRWVVARLLTSLGADRVETASSGAEAIATIEAAAEPCNVAICDLSMPDGDGLVFLRNLARLVRKPAVILMSGKDRVLLETAQQLGESLAVTILGTIIKPLTGVALMQLLDTLSLPEAMARPMPPVVLTEAEIASSLDAGRFELWFQPQCHIPSGHVVGVEALIRLRDVHLGLLGPASFIDTAEQCGLIARLTNFVLDEAVTWSGRWRTAGYPVTVAINLSKAGLNDLTLPDRAAALCAAHDVAPSQLTFELTESSLPTDGPALLDIMARLRLKGFRLSLDDFGTGFASLEQLRSLPFHELKLDTQFVQSAVHNARSRAILQGAIGLAAELDMSTVAEGVETPAMLQMVVDLGCHVAQGYLVAKPMSAEQVLEWLKQGPVDLSIVPADLPSIHLDARPRAVAVVHAFDPEAPAVDATVEHFVHDAAGPLMMVLVLSQMLLDTDRVSDEQRQDLGQIHSSAEEVSAMIQALREQTVGRVAAR